MPNSELVQSLMRGMDLLKLISSSPNGLRLNELCAATGLKKSTVHNLMRTLCAGGFAWKDEMQHFRLGAAIADLAGATPLSRRLRHAHKAIQHLGKLFPDCTITLAALTGAEVRCMLRVTPGNATVQMPRNPMLPYVSLSSMIFQAFYPKETRLLEEQYPFDEYGAYFWKKLKNFTAAKEMVIKAGYCRRISNNMVRAAFLLPEFYALGFCFRSGQSRDWDAIKAAVAEFRSSVWEKKEEII